MVGSRGQRNTSGKAGKVGLQEGGVREARKVQAAPEAVYSSADSGAVGAPSGRRVRNANRPTHGSVSELGPRLHPWGGGRPAPDNAVATNRLTIPVRQEISRALADEVSRRARAGRRRRSPSTVWRARGRKS